MTLPIKKYSFGILLAIGLSTPALAQQGERPTQHPQHSNHTYYPTSPGQSTGQQHYPSQGQGTQFGQQGYQGYGYGQQGQSDQYRNYPTQGQGYQGQENQGQGYHHQSQRYGSGQGYQGQGYQGQGQGQGRGRNQGNGRWNQNQYGGGYGSQYGQGQRGYGTPCPPGLMDKGCMPPGQAKKYQIGQRLPSSMTRMLDYARYGLHRPAPGYYYSRDHRDVVMVQEATHHVVGLVTVLDELF